MAGNNTNNIRCEYCNGVSGLIIMENVFKLKNLGNEMEYCLHSQNGRYSIGRELGVHIAVSKNTGVSRRHASVWVGNDSKLYISDAYVGMRMFEKFDFKNFLVRRVLMARMSTG